MRILAVNCGSSTLKFKLIEVSNGGLDRERHIAGGKVERIGGDLSTVDFSAEDGTAIRRPASVRGHEEAMRLVLDWLEAAELVGPEGPEAVGHRIVHGADHFSEPAFIEDDVVAVIEDLGDLAPLHNRPSLAAVGAARKSLGLSVPMVAVFDTAFHRTLPEHASRYAIPRGLADTHRIRRYGFHGTAHRYMVERYAAIMETPVEQANLITLQLGNGCSVAAIRGGLSVDTSMGFTPLEGLVMGTRSGDTDPSLVGFLARKEGVDAAEVEGWLNTRSGLLGVSGTSRDMRELLEAESRGDGDASLAIDMFCYRARKYVGSYLVVLGGADAVIFGGGIGENAPEVRARICEGMNWCGLALDAERNDSAVGSEVRISAEGSSTRAYVIPVDEEAMIVRDTVRCLRREQTVMARERQTSPKRTEREWHGG
jgi:acetate kinase